MIFKIEENLYFDSENIYIIRDKKTYIEKFLKQQKQNKIPNQKNENVSSLVFLSATKCNLKCSYCYASEGNYPGISPKKKTFTIENYKKVYSLISKKYKIRQIGFFGGEPLINFKEIKSFVRYLYDNFEFSDIPLLGINSNGTIMNEEIRDFITKYKILFGTSLDGPKYLNDICRYNDSIESVYDKVITTIKFLGEAGVKPAIQFTFNVNHIKHYKYNDAIKWLTFLESLPISFYTMIAATTDNENCKINLNDEKIKNNFVLMCKDVAKHSLNNFIKEDFVLSSPVFAILIYSIVKRETSKECCRAGTSILTISPDMKVYPCHVVATNENNSVNLVSNFHQKTENSRFDYIKNLSPKNFDVCKKCIAVNICQVFCKGMCCDDLFSVNGFPHERCLMMQIFLKETILFLADNFSKYKKNIQKNLKYYTNKTEFHAYSHSD